MFHQALDSAAMRAVLAAALSLAVVVLCAPYALRFLDQRCAEPNKSPSEELRHLNRRRRRTPTMGGLVILAGITVALFMLADWSAPLLPAALVALVGMAGVGAVDDLVKLRTRARGLTVRAKLAMQFAVATFAAWMVYCVGDFAPWTFIPWAALVVVVSANAVNLADGLDGLAAGCYLVTAAAIATILLARGSAGELAVVVAAAAGAALGFFWFNCHPASVFMGNTGSLALGGLVGLCAVAARQELVLFVAGGVFAAELLSVVVQVASFRLRGTRVLLCAPLHHHFQLAGWPDGKIVVRFWIASLACAALATAQLALGDGARNSSSAPVVARQDSP